MATWYSVDITCGVRGYKGKGILQLDAAFGGSFAELYSCSWYADFEVFISNS
jgi:hypothetical protein